MAKRVEASNKPVVTTVALCKRGKPREGKENEKKTGAVPLSGSKVCSTLPGFAMRR